jgi:hypothetical protein
MTTRVEVPHYADEVEHIGTWDRLRRIDHRIWDTLLAFVMLAGGIAGLLLGQRGEEKASIALGIALMVTSSVPLVWRRRAPLTVAAVVVASDAVLTSHGFTTTGGFAVAIALYTAAAYREWVRLMPTLLVLAALEAVAFVIDEANWVEVLVGVLIAAGIPIAFGGIVFNRRVRIARDREVAAQQPGQVPANGETQPGSAVLACGAVVRLLELLEDPRQGLVTDADARIRYRDT